MQISRKKTRRYLLQKLYARMYTTTDDSIFEEAFFNGRFDFELDTKYVNEMLDIVIQKQDVLLSIIAKYAPKFDIDTMLKTSILALIIAISEMLYLEEEIPAKVSINEAIDLTKYFGDDASKNIVNGILHSFYNEREKIMKMEIAEGKKFHFFIEK